MMNDSLTNTKRYGKAIMHRNSDQKRVINQIQKQRIATLRSVLPLEGYFTFIASDSINCLKGIA